MPWLIEVNASPNVRPSSAPQRQVLARLCAHVVDHLAAPARAVMDDQAGSEEGPVSMASTRPTVNRQTVSARPYELSP
jgi:hypothetical protein